MTPTGFLDDGYTISAVIEEDEGFHPTITVEYRPMLPAQRARLFQRIGLYMSTDGKDQKQAANDAELAEFISAEAMALQTKAWSLRNGAGEPVEITKENMLRIDSRLSLKLFNLITGRSKPKLIEDALGNSATG